MLRYSPPFGLASEREPLTRNGPVWSFVEDDIAMAGGVHVPSAPGVSGFGRGAESAVPLRLSIKDTDVSKLRVVCILRKV